MRRKIKMSKKEDFNENTTALEVVDGLNLNGYTAIVTGASSGIGVETVRALAHAGATCIICARDMAKAQEVAEQIVETTKNPHVHVEKLELDSVASVNGFVQRFLARKSPLHILINNAGVMGCPKSKTRDGFETQFGTNHMGHFALTLGLLPALKEAAKQSGRASRVVNLASSGHALADVDLSDLNFEQRDYDEFLAYCQSKTANMLFTVALNKKYASEGVVSNAVMPGAILTNMQRYMSKDDWVKRGWLNDQGDIVFKMKSLEAGAATSVWAAVSPSLEGKGGLYLENCTISKQAASIGEIYANLFGYMPHAMNEKTADELWTLSEELLKKAQPK